LNPHGSQAMHILELLRWLEFGDGFPQVTQPSLSETVGLARISRPNLNHIAHS
jgi:hypothetical protein